MIQYDVTISSKGQLVLPKEIRNKFRLNSGSKIKIIVDGEQIILQPRTVADELQDIIFAEIAKDGKTINEETVKEYHMVATADQEYNAKEYVYLADLQGDN
jgi:AbrB family looped-hinge helix DNA binding protein